MTRYKDIPETKSNIITIDGITYCIESENYYATKNRQLIINNNAEISRHYNVRVFINSDEFSEEKAELLGKNGNEIVILPASAFTENHIEKSDSDVHDMTRTYSIHMIC